MEVIRAVLLIGHTNSGKSPLGAAIERELSSPLRRLAHLDFGEHLRMTLDGRFDPALDAAERAFLRSVMDGRLLDNEHFSIARKVLSRFLQSCTFDPGRDILLLNGMPRHEGQARDTAAMGIDVRLVVYLHCPPDEALRRKLMADRGSGYEDRCMRLDNALEVFERKVRSFEQETLPLLEYYRTAGVAVKTVEVTGDMTPQRALSLVEPDLRGL